MLWLVLVFVALGSTIGSLIVGESAQQGGPVRQQAARAWRRSGYLLGLATGTARRRIVALARRTRRPGPLARPTFGRQDGFRAGPRQARWERRPRAVAVVELVLYIVVLGTLFAGALAAVAMRLGHFGA